MASETIITSFADFTARFPDLAQKQRDSKRMASLERYFAQKLVLSVGSIPNGANWPEIVYPTKMKLKHELSRLEKSKSDLSKRHKHWQGLLTKAKLFDVTNEITKFSEPVYWKHIMQYVSNADYRRDADSVKLPVHLSSRKRWKPMIEMFVNNLDYRKQLTQTVEQSIVYRQNKQLARYAGELQALRTQQSQKNVDYVKKLLDNMEADIDMFRELMSWAKK